MVYDCTLRQAEDLTGEHPNGFMALCPIERIKRWAGKLVALFSNNTTDWGVGLGSIAWQNAQALRVSGF